MGDKPGPVTLGRGGDRDPRPVSSFFVSATGAFGRTHGLPDPLAGRALSPQAVEGTTARGRLRGAKRDHLKLAPVPTPTQDFGRGRASSPGQGKEDFANELPRKTRPVKKITYMVTRYNYRSEKTQNMQSQQKGHSLGTPSVQHSRFWTVAG